MNPILWFVGVVLLSTSLTTVPAIAGDDAKQPTVKFTQTRQRYYYGTVWTGLNQDEMDQFTQDPMKFIKENKRKVRSLTPQQWATDVKELTHEQQVQFFQSLYKNESKEAFDPETRAEARTVLIERFKSAADEAEQKVGRRQSAAPPVPQTRTVRVSSGGSVSTPGSSVSTPLTKSSVTSVSGAKASGPVTQSELDDFGENPTDKLDVLRRMTPTQRAAAVKDLPNLKRISLLKELGTMKQPSAITRAEMDRLKDFRTIKTELETELLKDGSPKFARNVQDARQQIDAINSTTNSTTNRERNLSTVTNAPPSTVGRTNVSAPVNASTGTAVAQRTSPVSAGSGTKSRTNSVSQLRVQKEPNLAAFRENPVQEIDQLNGLSADEREKFLLELSREKKIALLSQLLDTHPMKSVLKEKYPGIVADMERSQEAKVRAEARAAARAANAQGAAVTPPGGVKRRSTKDSEFNPYLDEGGVDQLLKEFPNLSATMKPGAGDCISGQYLEDLKNYIDRLKSARDSALNGSQTHKSLTRLDVQVLVDPYASALNSRGNATKALDDIKNEDDKLFTKNLFELAEKEKVLKEAYERQSALLKDGGVEYLKARKDYYGKLAGVMEAHIRLHQYDRFAQANDLHQTSQSRGIKMRPDDRIFPSGESTQCTKQWKRFFAKVQDNIGNQIAGPGLGDMQTVLNGVNPNAGSETRAVNNTTTLTINSKLYGSGSTSSSGNGKQGGNGSAGANKAATAK